MTGMAKGLKCEFAPGSILQSGGGMKGFKDAPANWQDLIKEFFGIGRICKMYGMSECIGSVPPCEHNHYHFFPYTIPYILDEDANPLPREGVQTGRAAFYDLLADTYWGGFVSGDEITVNWTDPCPCGKTTVHIARQVERYGLQRGGDDKISCAAAADAHDAALRYLTDALQ